MPQKTREDLLELAYAALASQGWCVIDGLLSHELCLSLLSSLNTKQEKGELRAARVGKAKNARRNASIRGDFIKWLDPLQASANEALMLEEFISIGEQMSRRMLMAFNSFECHYACYPPGSFYRKHMDVFETDDSRFLSSVLYLNREWQPGDGGELRLYREGSEVEIDADVEPRFGRIALFLSRNIFHEVLPTSKARRSLTGWFKHIPVHERPLGLLL